MVLTSHMLTVNQRCPRRLIIESIYRYRRPSPTSLFSRLMRDAIFSLSNGADIADVTETAVSSFHSIARAPGLDVISGSDVYAATMDLTACMRTILEYLSRCPLLTVSKPPPVQISASLSYQPLAWVDDSGMAHRWRFLDYISESDIVAENRSWYVAGDVMAMNAPMTLHLVAIGSIRRTASIGGREVEPYRRYSSWCRGYKDRTNFNRIRFNRKKDGKILGPAEDWIPVYFADLHANSKQPDASKNWVNSMLAAGIVGPSLIRHVHIEIPPKPALFEFSRHLQLEADRIASLPEYYTQLPHFRPACDHPTLCPHIYACYERNFDFARSGLYDKIKS